MADGNDRVTIDEIERVMEEKVRPELALHNGNIVIESYEDGVLRVRLLGECSNCPSADLTMENIVETVLNEELPKIREIKLSTGVSDSLIEEARAMLRKRHEK